MARVLGFRNFIDLCPEDQKRVDAFDRMVYARLSKSVDADDIQEFVAYVVWNEAIFDVPEGFSPERRLHDILSSFITAGGL